MAEGLTALVGLHGDPSLAFLAETAFSVRKYAVVSTRDPDEMLKFAEQGPYSVYFMDLNLGTEQGMDVTPAVKVYDVVRKSVESGEADFMAISGLSEIVSAGLDKGIPSAMKSEFSIIQWLREISARQEST